MTFVFPIRLALPLCAALLLGACGQLATPPSLAGCLGGRSGGFDLFELPASRMR